MNRKAYFYRGLASFFDCFSSLWDFILDTPLPKKLTALERLSILYTCKFLDSAIEKLPVYDDLTKDFMKGKK